MAIHQTDIGTGQAAACRAADQRLNALSSASDRLDIETGTAPDHS